MVPQRFKQKEPKQKQKKKKKNKKTKKRNKGTLYPYAQTTIEENIEEKAAEVEEEDTTATQPEKEIQEEKEKEGEEPEVEDELHHRYYHMFKEGELEELISRIDGAVVEEHGFDHQNWYAVIRKGSE